MHPLLPPRGEPVGQPGRGRRRQPWQGAGDDLAARLAQALAPEAMTLRVGPEFPRLGGDGGARHRGGEGCDGVAEFLGHRQPGGLGPRIGVDESVVEIEQNGAGQGGHGRPV
jgi:hypothetical protein